MRYTKAVNKKMRELSNQAYERELRQELKKLAEQFKLWEDSQIDTWDLEQKVHKFHNGAARELYKRYDMVSPEMILPYALFKEIIMYEELPEEIVDDMKMRVSMLYDHKIAEQEYFNESE